MCWGPGQGARITKGAHLLPARLPGPACHGASPWAPRAPPPPPCLPHRTHTASHSVLGSQTLGSRHGGPSGTGLAPAEGWWLGQGYAADQDRVPPPSPRVITLCQEQSASQVPLGATVSLLKRTAVALGTRAVRMVCGGSSAAPLGSPLLGQRQHPRGRGWTPGTCIPHGACPIPGHLSTSPTRSSRTLAHPLG